MRRTFHLTISALVLTSFTATQATISLPTIAPVPIPAGVPITDGGGATLDGYVSHDIIVNTTTDWIATALLIQLDSGSIYQEKEGVGYNGITLGQPDPALFGLFPSSEFDSYVFDPHGAAAFTGAAGDVGGNSKQFDSNRIDVTWNSAGSDRLDIGPSHVSRITLSGDAQGTWSMAYVEAFNPNALRLYQQPIINGQMVLAPLIGDLNFDGFVGIEDLNFILGAWNQIVTPGSQPDPSSDGFVGIADLNVVMGNWNAGFVPLIPGSQPGVVGTDLNDDGFVGIDDLTIWLSNWNLLVPPGDPRADPSGDGFVGIADKVTGNWNAGTPPAPIPGSSPPAVVPEPAGIAIFCVGLTLFACRSGRR